MGIEVPKPVTRTLLERFETSKKCISKKPFLEGSFVTQRHIDTIDFTALLRQPIDGRCSNTREYIFNIVQNLIGIYFENLDIRWNVGKDKLIAHDDNKYCYVVIERNISDYVIRVQLKGRFYNVGRYLGVDVMGYTQSIFRELMSKPILPYDDLEPIEFKIRQLDICQNHSGFELLDMIKNYYKVTSQIEWKNSTDIERTRLKPILKNDKELGSLETLYINLKNPRGRISDLTLKIYSKTKHILKLYKDDTEYLEWYRDNFGNEENVIRVEMSHKSPVECSGITEYFKRFIKSGEIIDERELCLGVLGTAYKGNQKSNRSSGCMVKMNTSKDRHEPLLKSFCTLRGNKHTYIEKIRPLVKNPLKPEELYWRNIQKVNNKHLLSISKKRMFEIYKEKHNDKNIQGELTMT
jgi:hypothetical protein